MSHMFNPLLDKEFLIDLYNHRDRQTYVKIIALNFNEEPLQSIEGTITQGSINIDGASAVRRTCSLTMITKDVEINDFYWGFKNKFKLEIGLKNYVNKNYPDIIWFPQGMFIITNFNSSQSTNNYTINISGKDKMCLLNGDLGGQLPASIDFGIEEYYDKDSNITTYTPIPIKNIIKEMLHAYALEPYHNIIINDLDESAVELLDYKGDVPLYLLKDIQADQYTNFTLDGTVKVYFKDADSSENFNLEDLEEMGGVFDPRIELDPEAQIKIPSKIIFLTDPLKREYSVSKVIYGQPVGYRLTDLTYAGELISKIGDTITSILDKIKNMLGEFEYFYNLDGRFVFQRKKIYTQNSWNNIIKTGEEEYVENSAYSSADIYKFEDSKLITSFQNSPNLANLKNDFSIWGERETASGVKIPIHYRFAIQEKPVKYKNLNGIEFSSDEYDWRELIYQMALDYYAHGQEEDFLYQIIDNNPDEYPTGITGYEQYYLDLQGFWRQLYDGKNWIDQNPSDLNFWFNFLDVKDEANLNKFAVNVIGSRAKAVNDSNIKAIYYKEVPTLIFTTYKDYQTSDLKNKKGYTPVFMTGNLESMFHISYQGKSAQDALDELLYNHSYCIESATVQVIPIYHLDTNTRIFVRDDISKINGEYIVSKLSIPLAYNGTMSITATKAPQRLI